MPLFFPERECIGNYPSNSRGVLTIYSIHSCSIKKNENYSGSGSCSKENVQVGSGSGCLSMPGPKYIWQQPVLVFPIAVHGTDLPESFSNKKCNSGTFQPHEKCPIPETQQCQMDVCVLVQQSMQLLGCAGDQG